MAQKIDLPPIVYLVAVLGLAAIGCSLPTQEANNTSPNSLPPAPTVPSSPIFF